MHEHVSVIVSMTLLHSAAVDADCRKKTFVKFILEAAVFLWSLCVYLGVSVFLNTVFYDSLVLTHTVWLFYTFFLLFLLTTHVKLL